jgi:hypothetical protein
MRIGNKAGLRELRVIARTKARAMIAGVDHANIFMSKTNASSNLGNESTKRSPLKNDSRTRSQRGNFGIRKTSAPIIATVLSAAMMLLRRRCRCSNCCRSLLVSILSLPDLDDIYLTSRG